MKNKNLFVELLRGLNVKYTRKFALNLYEGHPYRDSLYGLSEMLSIYKIENNAIKLENKEQIISVETPFISHINGEFILVKKIDKEKGVVYLWKNVLMKIPIKNFLSAWSGIALIVETNTNSIEPNYKKNSNNDLLIRSLDCLLFILVILFIGYFFIISDMWRNGLWIILLELLVGCFICYMLMQKQLNIESDYVEKLCSFFKENGCNDVLKSGASKFLGIFAWSEIGFSYFITMTLVLLLSSDFNQSFYWINICALPYTIWSIWYQNHTKQWCLMCSIVMILIWVIFVTCNSLGIKEYLFPINYSKLIILVCIYTIIFLIVHKFVYVFSKSLLIDDIKNEMMRIKMNEYVFHSLLVKSKSCPVSLDISQIVFGNRESKIIITVLTNPHCEPCANMHRNINSLLDNSNGKFCVQYIFASFNDDLDISCKMLIDAFHKNSEVNIRRIFDEWFDNGKYNKEEFFDKYNLEINDNIEKEFKMHKAWIEKNLLHETPLVFINGFLLPSQYKIEDLYQLEIILNE